MKEFYNKTGADPSAGDITKFYNKAEEVKLILSRNDTF